MRQDQPAVLLIYEIDRADEEFEAFLLEVLSDYQISIPELGTVHAQSIPLVVLTSNGTRELSDALRRRCLYHFVDYPTEDKEARILTTRLPQRSEEHTSELQSLMRISYAVFCLKKKKTATQIQQIKRKKRKKRKHSPTKPPH